MIKITAIIPTLNEEYNIQGAIESCTFADEIIVVDSFSSDETCNIARKYSQVSLLQREFDTHAKQKNWAIDQASHDWIFILDADERTSPKLIKEIQEILNSVPENDAYWIGRENVFMDQQIGYIWRGDKVIRLLDRRLARYPEVHVHEEIEVKGATGELCNRLLHDTYTGKGWNFQVEKGHRYTTLSALDKIERTGKVGIYHLFVKPLATFFKQYILKGGILDGKAGYTISVLATWNVFERYIKIWRMRQGEKFKDGQS